jgi:signal transduction histidine kinase
VSLTRDGNPGIREVASRQAVMETDDFEFLKVQFVQYVFEQLELFRKGDDKKTKPVIQHQIKAQLNLDQAKRNIKRFVKDPEKASQIINHIDVASKEMKGADKANVEERSDLVGTLNMYRPLATLGISTLAFDHEIGQKFARIGTYLYILKEMENLPAKALESINLAEVEMRDVQAWREFLDLFATALSGMGSSRKAREEINLREMAEALAKSLKPVLVVGDKAGNDIEINVNTTTIGRGYKVVANRAALISVFTNLFINSMKSLRFAQRAKPVIDIKIWRESNQLLIEFHDNGNGVPDENIKQIWIPFFSSYPKRGVHSTLRGMGLGLTLTKEIIEEQYLGSIELSKTKYDKEKPGKGFATFLISIPLKELEGKK